MVARKPLATSPVPAPLRQAPNNPPYPTESTMPPMNGSGSGKMQTQSEGFSAPDGPGQRSRASSVSSADTWNTDPSEPNDNTQSELPASLKPGPNKSADSRPQDIIMSNGELQNSTYVWQEDQAGHVSASYQSQNPYLRIRSGDAPSNYEARPPPSSDIASNLAPSEELASLMLGSPNDHQHAVAPSYPPPPPPPVATAPLVPPLPPQDTGSQNSHHSNPWQDDLDREQERLQVQGQRPSPDAQLPLSAHATPSPGKEKQSVSTSAPPPPPLKLAETSGSAVGRPDIETPRTRARRQTGESYHIKHVNWYDASAQKGRGALRNSPILTQNSNGPCPILALVNALSLSTPEHEESALVDALKSREQVSLGLLLDAVFEELVRRNENIGTELPDIGDLYAFLVTLHTGMNVNPAFTRQAASQPGGFEQTKEMELYGAFHIPLVHGWITTFGSETYRAFERSAKTFDEALNVQFLEEEFNSKLEAGGLSAEEQQVFEDLTAVKHFLTTYPTQLSDHGLDTVASWLHPGQIAILFRNDHFCTVYREPSGGTLMTLVTDTGYATHDEIVWESLADINGALSEFFSGDFRPVGASRQPSTPAAGQSSEPTWQMTAHKNTRSISQSKGFPDRPSPLSRSQSRSEQEDMDLALALQLQEEEEEASRREEARRLDAHNESLSRQYLDQQSIEADQRPPQIPPRRSPRSTTGPSTQNTQAFNSSSRTDDGDAPPPSYEQAASDPPYREAGSTPQPPRQGNALGALSALGAQRQQSTFGAQSSQQGPPSYGRRPSNRMRSYSGAPQAGYPAAGPSTRFNDGSDEKCIVQ